jgi:hypothetical protein
MQVKLITSVAEKETERWRTADGGSLPRVMFPRPLRDPLSASVWLSHGCGIVTLVKNNSYRT